MRRVFVVAAACLLSASVCATAGAAPAGKAVAAKQPQGLKNARKVMQARFDREKKMAEVRKQALAKKHQAQNGK
ncbi:hypothetical protein LPW11_00075 [Geomonas sp. RF6]|uniref:hypothetical protein n=1 Tax=Geomonas sp. RF6 TaxID=2897342 RepID=UPI001E340AE0|nr:hypothetical protein [Geomonas sp. RF6]UFS70605.1 hypothetical protein LPW11_00075 [Geomonas sp. RF6]